MRSSFVLFFVVILTTGCRDVGMPDPNAAAQKAQDYKARKILTPQNSRRPARQSAQSATQSEIDLIAKAYQQTRSTSFQTGRPEEVAVRKATKAIDASLELGPTLVVWLFDRTASAQKLVTQAVGAAKEYYESPEIRQRGLANDDSLRTVVVGFDERAEFLLDPPASDWQQVTAALDKIAPVATGREMTFAAVQQTLDKYLKVRTDERREVLLILVTDEVGDDAQSVDALSGVMQRAAIPLYVVGVPAPWGQTNPVVTAEGGPKADDTAPVHGPESLFSERVNFTMEQLASASGVGFSAPLERKLVDSGFGSFALEKLCRASGGEFLIVRPVGDEGYSYRGTTWEFWPTGNELRFDDGAASRYSPDYVSAEEYRLLLSENKARLALHEAAKLPPTIIPADADLRFAKANEAKTVQQLNRAQQFAARHAPAIDRVFAVLQPGEADRDKLTGARWQAQFDLAMGQVAAAKVRVDGYNSMIAALKRGKTFQNPASQEWVLVPSDTIETGSTLQNLANRARSYLERVVHEHPGTPWAKLAADDLKTPLGWTWREE